jgi:hypothetical protein
MKIKCCFLAILLLCGTLFAAPPTEVPNKFYVTQHWISYTTSFDIETKTQKLGTLYRRVLSLLLTYDFYDNFNKQLAYARARFFSLTAKFDVYDMNENLLGTAEEELFAFFPSFTMYADDATTKLAYASMNFWGTTFTIYDPETDKEMAQMTRSFFRVKNDWAIEITDERLFARKHIDTRLLMTVLAFQGDREYWEEQRRNDPNNQLHNRNALSKEINQAADAIKPLTQKILTQLHQVAQEQNLDLNETPDQALLESMAKKLQAHYNSWHAELVRNATTQEKLADFADYCFAQVKLNDISVSQKQAILVLLKMRLGN